MPPTKRRPGDQAPPPRPIHRNDGKTASTHVKDASGSYYVHDGDGNVLELDGRQLAGLTRDEARRMKDVAVTKHKFRRAGIRQHETSELPDFTPDLEDVPDVQPTPPNRAMPPPGVSPLDHARARVVVPVPDAPSADPVLEAQRQAALAAARPAAQQAQQRHDKQKPKPGAKPVQRAPGWEPPPAGVTAARQAPKIDKHAPVVRAPGFESPKGGENSAPPEAVAAVDLNPIEGDDSVEIDESVNDDNLADALAGPDMETDVKETVEKTENKVILACKALKIGDAVVYFPDDTDDSITAKVVAVHAPTCITLQLPGDDDEVLIADGDTGASPIVATELHGAVLRSVMLSPQQGKRAQTWQPIL